MAFCVVMVMAALCAGGIAAAPQRRRSPITGRRRGLASAPVNGSVLSIRSKGSVLSIDSVGSVLSIGSIGSVLSVGSIGSAGSLLSVGSFASVGIVLCAFSVASVLSLRSIRGVLAGPSGLASVLGQARDARCSWLAFRCG